MIFTMHAHMHMHVFKVLAGRPQRGHPATTAGIGLEL